MSEIKRLKQKVENTPFDEMQFIQAKAIILLAEQVERLNDMLEQTIGYNAAASKCIRVSGGKQ